MADTPQVSPPADAAATAGGAGDSSEIVVNSGRIRKRWNPLKTIGAVAGAVVPGGNLVSEVIRRHCARQENGPLVDAYAK